MVTAADVLLLMAAEARGGFRSLEVLVGLLTAIIAVRGVGGEERRGDVHGQSRRSEVVAHWRIGAAGAGEWKGVFAIPVQEPWGGEDGAGEDGAG